LVKAAPLERILGETDAPYLSPEPYRGKRNVPARVVEVVKIISQIKNVELSIVENQIEKNTRELFEI
jgi:TatD DNase family protein